MMQADRSLLDRIRGERGYTLSYHEIYSRLEPSFLEAYADLYRACTLTPRALDARRREAVWVALLAAIDEEVGSIHLDRAIAAGASSEDLADAVRLAALADTWPTLAFAHRHWQAYLEPATRQTTYLRLVEDGRGGIGATTADLVLMVVQAAQERPEPYLLHLQRCHQAGLPEVQIAEALSYLLQPCGANRLLWATDRWLDALRDGTLPPSPTLGTAELETRRA